MKRLLVLLCWLPIAVVGVEREALDRALQVAASARGTSYLVSRTSIIDFGTNALPFLVQAGVDSSLSWQQRLVARICCERIMRGRDIDSLRRYNWRGHPGYETQWEKGMMGPCGRLTAIAVPYFVTVDLPYYYIEVTWKATDELAQSPLYMINNYWRRWCGMALSGRAEEQYLLRAVVDRVTNDALLNEPGMIDMYKFLRDSKWADATPVLIERYDVFNRCEVTGMELFPGRHAELYRGMFEPIIAMSDSRHADLLEKFISAKPALAPLKDRVALVRARPAPPVQLEPPFRLGTNVVVIAQ